MGEPVDLLAYPFGASSPEAFDAVEEAGYVAAFQLVDDPLDPERPLLSLRRLIANPDWSGADLVAALESFS